MPLKYFKFITALLFLFCSSLGFAENSLIAAEKEEIKKNFTGGSAQVKKAIDLLEWTGISDPSVFTTPAERLKAGYMSESKVDLETNSWLAKGLALSGDPKHKELLNNIFNSEAPKKLRKHVKIALNRIDQFTVWNPIISAGTDAAKSQTELDLLRIKNMFNSNRGDLMGVATRKVYFNHVANLELTNMLSIKLKEKYASASTADDVDAYSWMCRTLAESGNKEYKTILEEVANNPQTNKKLAKYAKKYAAYL